MYLSQGFIAPLIRLNEPALRDAILVRVKSDFNTVFCCLWSVKDLKTEEKKNDRIYLRRADSLNSS